MGAPFARLLANIVVMGGGVLGRAFLDAYKQALNGGGPSAAATAAKGAVRRGRGGLLEGEARQILNVKPKATDDEIREAATKLVAMNDPDKGGSKYLTHKFNNAREMLVGQPPEELRKPPEADASSK